MIYEEAFWLPNDLLAAKTLDQKWQLIDRNGKSLIKEPFDDYKTRYSTILITKEGKSAFCAPLGKQVTGYSYRGAFGYNRESAALQIARELKLPPDIKLLGSGISESGAQVFIGSNGKEYLMDKN